MIYVCKLFLIFLFCSFFGWLMEVTFGENEKKKFINRGYLIGPVCPIYGFGAMAMYFCLNSFREDSIMVWVLGMAIASILEYVTSLVLEKLFCLRWWDYSQNKLNIEGRICAEAMGLFGILSLILIYFVFPFSLDILSHVNETFLVGLSIIFFIVLILDILISTRIISKHKKEVKNLNYDMTEEISLYVKGTITDLMSVNGISWKLPINEKLSKFKKVNND